MACGSHCCVPAIEVLHYPSRGQEPAKVKDETLEEMGQGAHSFKCSYLIPSLF